MLFSSILRRSRKALQNIILINNTTLQGEYLEVTYNNFIYAEHAAGLQVSAARQDFSGIG